MFTMIAILEGHAIDANEQQSITKAIKVYLRDVRVCQRICGKS